MALARLEGGVRGEEVLAGEGEIRVGEDACGKEEGSWLADGTGERSRSERWQRMAFVVICACAFDSLREKEEEQCARGAGRGYNEVGRERKGSS